MPGAIKVLRSLKLPKRGMLSELETRTYLTIVNVSDKVFPKACPPIVTGDQFVDVGTSRVTSS